MATKKSPANKSNEGISRRNLLIGGAALGLAGAGVGYWLAHRDNANVSNPFANGTTAADPDAPYVYTGDHAARNFLTAHGIATLGAIAQTVIPSTVTPGAKEINAIAYMEMKLDEELAAARAEGKSADSTILEMLHLGIQLIDQVIGANFNTRFVDLAQVERDEFFEIVVDGTDPTSRERFDPEGLLRVFIHEIALHTFDAYYSHPIGMRTVGYNRLPIQGYPDYMKKPT